MKRKLLFIIAVISSITALSQPVLTYEDLQLKLGTKYVLATLDHAINHGDSGENIVWDFSNLQEMTLNEYIVSESDSTFPQANYNLKSIDNSNNYYYENASSRYTLGVYSQSLDLKIVYDNPALAQFFPLEYGKIMHDTFSGHYELGGNYSITKGTVFFKCDAYGTVVTSNSTYKNAIRVYRKEVIKDYSAANDMTIETESYSWHVEGYSMPVFSISIIVTDFSTIYNTSFLNDLTISLNDNPKK